MEILVVVKTLLIKAIRRGLYTTLLISTLAPVLLLVVLFSTPSISSLEYTSLMRDKQVLVFSSSKSSGECYSAGIVTGSIIVNSSMLRAPVLVVSADPTRILGTLGLARGDFNESSYVVLPSDIYIDLGKPSLVVVEVENTTEEYSVAGSWGSNTVLLVTSSVNYHLDNHLCINSQRGILLSTVERAESELLRTAELWILVLSFVYLPVIYAAQRRVVESLRVDLRVLANSGVSAHYIYCSTTITLIVLYIIVVFYVCALGVVLVYTAWSALSYIVVLPYPALRSSIMPLLLLEVLLGVLVAPLASRGVSKWL